MPTLRFNSRPSSRERGRPALRTIKDTAPTYSAVAVDPINDEIFLQDENLFQIVVFDRNTDTPATAAFSEPKRVIGGHHTKMEFNCGLYIDPSSGDVYSVNNDTINTLVIFSREKVGDVPPTRELRTPHRTFGIAVDEDAEELFLTVQHPPEIVVYHKYASGRERPIRTMRGNSTQLEDAHGIALDPKNGWMFVSNYGNSAKYLEDSLGKPEVGDEDLKPGTGEYKDPSITVYPIKANGDQAPIRVIEGPKTQLNWPAHIHIDVDRGELFVANDGANSILVFDIRANGNVEPKRVLKGPRTTILNPTGVFVDTKNQELVVASMGNHSAPVFAIDAGGDVPPKRVIRSAPIGKMALQIGNPGAVSYDTKRNEILVPN